MRERRVGWRVGWRCVKLGGGGGGGSGSVALFFCEKFRR